MCKMALFSLNHVEGYNIDLELLFGKANLKSENISCRVFSFRTDKSVKEKVCSFFVLHFLRWGTTEAEKRARRERAEKNPSKF